MDIILWLGSPRYEKLYVLPGSYPLHGSGTVVLLFTDHLCWMQEALYSFFIVDSTPVAFRGWKIVKKKENHHNTLTSIVLCPDV